MAKGYTAVSMRMAVVALVCLFSVQVQAAHHGAMPKKHKMTCGQKVMALLCLSTGNVAAAMQCVSSFGTVGGKEYTTKTPICYQYGLDEGTLKAALSVALKKNFGTIQVIRIDTVSCQEESLVRSDGTMGVTTTCLPLHNLAPEHINTDARLARLPAPQQ